MKTRMRLFALLVGIAVIAGCGTKPGETSPDSRPGQDALAEQTVKVYYADEQMEQLHERTKPIRFANDEEKYAAAIKALTASDDSALYPLWVGLDVRSVEFKDGRVTVDIELADEGRLGAAGEQLALDALKRTLFQFDEVQEIELLVGGEQTDSLMGHLELEHPIRRNEP